MMCLTKATIIGCLVHVLHRPRNYVAHGGEKNLFNALLVDSIVFKVLDVRALKCVSLCAPTHTRTKKKNHTKAVKAHFSGLIEKKCFYC